MKFLLVEVQGVLSSNTLMWGGMDYEKWKIGVISG